MPLLDSITKIFSGSAGDIVEKIAGAADKFITTGQEKEEFKLKVQQQLDLRDQAIRDSITKEMELQLKDVADARGLQIAALNQEDRFSKRFIYYFALLWSFAAIGFLTAITFGTIPVENTRFADTILGFMLGTIVAAIITYFFGSSLGSKRNADAIRNIAEKTT